MIIKIKAKCRNCGVIFIDGEQNVANYSKTTLLESLKKSNLEEINVSIHECSYIEWGIADGIGFIIEGD